MPALPAIPPELTTLLDAYASAFACCAETKREFEREEIGADILDQAEAERDAARASLVEYVAPLIEDKARLDWLNRQEGMSIGTTIGGGYSLRFNFDDWRYGATVRECVDLARSTPEAP